MGMSNSEKKFLEKNLIKRGLCIIFLKKRYMKKLLLLFSLLLMVGCNPVEYKDYHSEKIYLRQLVNKDVTKNYTSGSFFLIAGSVSSESVTSTVVKLMGEVNGEYRFMQFDFETVRIKIDNKVTTPYIVLNYRETYEVDTDYLLKYPYYLESITIVCPEQYLPERLLPIQI
jgi:uncharacterized protein YcfL